jgi:hypothetical protein
MNISNLFWVNDEKLSWLMKATNHGHARFVHMQWFSVICVRTLSNALMSQGQKNNLTSTKWVLDAKCAKCGETTLDLHGADKWNCQLSASAMHRHAVAFTAFTDECPECYKLQANKFCLATIEHLLPSEGFCTMQSNQTATRYLRAAGEFTNAQMQTSGRHIEH